MTSSTPGSCDSRAPSRRPSLTTTPIEVRCRPGSGCARYPISSITATTPRISSSSAPRRITISIPTSLARAVPGVSSDGFPLAEPHAHDGGHSGLLHGDTVDGIGRLHRPRIVSYDQKLGLGLELLEEAGEAPDVRIVEWRVRIVHEAEGARLVQIDAEEERDRDQGPLAGGEEVDPLGPFAAGGRVDLDLALEGVVGVGEAELALAAAEEGGEDAGGGRLHRGERLGEAVAGGAVDLADGEDQRLPRAHEVVPLCDEEIEALALLGVLLDGECIDRADRLERRDDARRLRLERLEVEVEQREPCEQLVERPAPFGLDALGDAPTEPCSLGQPDLEAVVLFAQRFELDADRLQRRLRLAECRGSGAERALRGGGGLLELAQ